MPPRTSRRNGVGEIERETVRLLEAARFREMRAARRALDLEDPERPLSEEEAKAAVGLTAGDAEMIRRLKRGDAPRNSQSILGMLKLAIDATVAKPRSDIGISGEMRVVVRTFADEEVARLGAAVEVKAITDGGSE